MNRALKSLAILLTSVVTALAATSPARAQLTVCQGRLILPLDFQSPILVSGTALQPGAIYRYTNVAAGVDAIVTILGVTNGSLTVIDRDTGLAPNFQPELSATGGNGGPRSADFNIRFVIAGTSTDLPIDFAGSAIDVDGDSASLREYAEFSNVFVDFGLETPTRLAVNASGPSIPSNVRFEASTSFTAPGIDPTATQNIVSAFFTNTASFLYRIGTLGSGGTTRLTSLGFDCPNITFPTSNPTVDQDFSDAPTSYGDPRHDFNTNYRIGATNTIETSAYNSPNASADAGDDGANMPALSRGVPTNIDVAVTGTGGLLQAFIDFGADGTFTTGGDQVATNVADGGIGDADGITNGNIRVNFTTPSGAAVGNTFARFRWGTQPGVNSTLTASNGEVEDYQITVTAAPPVPVCPSGQSFSNQTGNAVAVTTAISVVNPNRALGALTAVGTSPPDLFSAEMDASGDQFTIDLGLGIPENATLVASLARDGGGSGNNTQAEIFVSTNNSSFTSVGVYGSGSVTYPSSAQDLLERINITIPLAGTRYIRFDTLNNDDLFIDGVQYSQICVVSAEMAAQKSVTIYDPTSTGLFATPGNEVIYAITATNTGPGSVDADSIFLVDNLPSQVEFYNGDFNDGGPGTGAIEFTQTSAGLTFTEGTDLRFSKSASPPVNFAACTDSAAPGYDPTITYICFNPKGSMNAGSPDPTFTVRFRARIK